jgi:hypothetical protein
MKRIEAAKQVEDSKSSAASIDEVHLLRKRTGGTEVQFGSSNLPDEAIWYLSRACAVCDKRSMSLIACQRCDWVFYCCSEHRQIDSEMHSQVCCTVAEIDTRSMTSSEIEAERRHLLALNQRTPLPLSRLRASQQRTMTSWTLWFFMRMARVRMRDWLRGIASLCIAAPDR